MSRLFLLLALAPALVASPIGASAAAGFPSKPVRMIVPLAPGGGSDIVGRIVAQALTDHWGKAVVVDNRPGAGTVVGTSLAAKAAPDGYTLLVSSSSLAISPALYGNLDFDVVRDFAGITLIASQPSILVVNSSVAASSVKELVALAKSNSGRLAYASAGTGSATHLGTELLLHASGMQILHVPYKSAGQATAALISGETQVLFTNMASVMPHLASGKVKALGVSTRRRSELAPQLPTLDESGLHGFEYATWYGMLAPAGVPQSLVQLIHASTARIVRQPNVAQRLSAQGLQAYASTPTEFSRHLKKEIDRWAALVKVAHITGE